MFLKLMKYVIKKAQHPVELFYILALGITPVVPHIPYVTVYFYCLERPVPYVSII